jgi:Tfp pilus assembly protein PilX
MVSAQKFEQVSTEGYQSSVRACTAATALSAAEAGLKQAADTLVQQNDEVIEGAAYFVAEVCSAELRCCVVNKQGQGQFPR